MHIGLLVKDFATGDKFSKDGVPIKSGAEFHAENHALQLIRRGHQVSIFTRKRSWKTKARERNNGIDIVRLHALFRWLELLVRLVTTHCSINTFYIIGVPKFAVWAIIYAKLVNKPVTMAITGNAEIFNGSSTWRNRIFTRCDQYIAISQEIRQGFIKNSGIAPDKITVLSQGIDVKRFPYVMKHSKEAYKKKNNIAPQAHVLLFCARVVLDKGIDTLIKAWPIIRSRDVHAHLLVVGGGKFELLDELRELGKANDDSVTVVGEVEKPQDYYPIADVYIFPSRHEGMPTTLMEAMSSGLPSVVFDIGGCEDLIKDGVNGYRVDCEDVSAFAEKALYLLQNTLEADKMGEAASDFIKENMDYSQIIWRIEQILEKH